MNNCGNNGMKRLYYLFYESFLIVALKQNVTKSKQKSITHLQPLAMLIYRRSSPHKRIHKRKEEHDETAHTLHLSFDKDNMDMLKSVLFLLPRNRMIKE